MNTLPPKGSLPEQAKDGSEPPSSSPSSSVTRKKSTGKTSVSLALTGSGGSGVMTAGQMLLDAAAHAGFSLVQVVSQCVTYRPEQRDWRNLVRPVTKEPTSNSAS